MKTLAREVRRPRAAQAGFTLVEALVAIVVLVFGLMAVTNLLLVAASSNTVANQGTAAVAGATQVMDFLKLTDFTLLPLGGNAFDATDGGPDCNDPLLTAGDFHCTTSTPGVGNVHVHWFITATGENRMLYIQVQAEGVGALTGQRSRAEFTTFRSCTDTAPAVACPAAAPVPPQPPPPPVP
jgi:type II secretory pathway pseudopilin PulG